ncbi:MAG: hypothetical protein QXN24_05440 [Candidatus Bathyarchaeia archaeon]
MKWEVTLAEIMIMAYFALVSILCVIIFILPVNVHESLKVRSDRWNFLVFFTSIFVHSDLEHLLGNILAFHLLGSIVYKINQKSNREKRLFVSFLLAISLLPLIYNALFVLLTIFVIRQPLVSCGLSIVVAGILGLVVPSLGIFLKEILQNERDAGYFLISLMFLTASAITAYTGNGAFQLAFFAVTFTVGSTLLLYVGRKMVNSVNQSLNAKRKISFASITIAIYFVFLSFLFPSNIITPEGNIVNIFAHFVGVFYGIISGIYTLNLFPKAK